MGCIEPSIIQKVYVGRYAPEITANTQIDCNKPLHH